MHKGKRVAIVTVVLVAAAQLIRPSHEDPPTDPSRTLAAQGEWAIGVAAVVDRSCRDCHTNTTVWPWFAQIAPFSWLMAYGVTQGRNIVNFSEWATYTPEKQRELLVASCRDARNGRMPGHYALVQPQTRLSPQDIETICAAAKRANASGPGVL
jgi:hypothetical protein